MLNVEKLTCNAIPSILSFNFVLCCNILRGACLYSTYTTDFYSLLLDDEEEEEEEDAKAEEGAVGGTSADIAGLSSDEDSEKCPICLNSFNSQPVATPETCEHYFCLDCILEWATVSQSWICI